MQSQRRWKDLCNLHIVFIEEKKLIIWKAFQHFLSLYCFYVLWFKAEKVNLTV